MSLKQPVRYPVKYYSHLDADAPQLADADGVIKTILKACLVTGYGDKASAGWTSLFEDTFRIVLRRPLGTGNPPDIKIENGVINGVASHRIVSQDSPNGLDDTVELAAVNLLARDSRHGSEWHLIASDFAFIFCYQMGENYSGSRNFLIFVGEMQRLSSGFSNGFFASSSAKINKNGTASSYMRPLLGVNDSATEYHGFVNLLTGKLTASDKAYVTLYDTPEKLINNDYFVQRMIFASRYLPSFHLSMMREYDDDTTRVVQIDGRAMLRYVNTVAINNSGYTRDQKPFYIPLDYWEL